jgi:hypothetical protein
MHILPRFRLAGTFGSRLLFSLVGKREPHLFEGRRLDLADSLGTDTKLIGQIMQGHTA